jgi:hypothetical protein
VKPLAKPEDKRKAAILGGAVVLVFLFVVKNTMSAISGGGAAPTTEAIAAPVGATGTPAAPVMQVATTQPTAVPKEADDLIDPINYPPNETPSPFHKDTDSYSGALDQPNVITAPPPPPPPPQNKRGPGSDFGQPLPTPGSTPVIIRPPDPMVAMGVMTGDNPVAVIRVGSQQYVVNKGAKFGHNLRLKSVSESQVVIEQGGELHILRVGARPPSATPDQPADKPIGT